MTEDLDTGVGMITEGVERLGIGSNTYLIYMSDNGAGGGGGRGPLNGGKGSVWEGGIRVPLIIRGPDDPENSFCHERVVGYDLFPTFCELAGVTDPLPNGIEGGSIVSLLSGAGEAALADGSHMVRMKSGEDPRVLRIAPARKTETAIGRSEGPREPLPQEMERLVGEVLKEVGGAVVPMGQRGGDRGLELRLPGARS